MRTTVKSLVTSAALAIAGLAAIACEQDREPLGAEGDGPFDATGAEATATGGTRITGRGAIGSSLAIPLSDRQEFDFDATDTPPGGRLFYRDWGFLRQDLTLLSGATLTADPAVDPATGISSFTQTSAACVTFGGRAVTDRGAYLYFSVDACDNGSPGVGVDTFAIHVYEVDFEYSRSGTLTEGEITLSTF